MDLETGHEPSADGEMIRAPLDDRGLGAGVDEEQHVAREDDDVEAPSENDRGEVGVMPGDVGRLGPCRRGSSRRSRRRRRPRYRAERARSPPDRSRSPRRARCAARRRTPGRPRRAPLHHRPRDRSSAGRRRRCPSASCEGEHGADAVRDERVGEPGCQRVRRLPAGAVRGHQAGRSELDERIAGGFDDALELRAAQMNPPIASSI